MKELLLGTPMRKRKTAEYSSCRFPREGAGWDQVAPQKAQSSVCWLDPQLKPSVPPWDPKAASENQQTPWHATGTPLLQELFWERNGGGLCDTSLVTQQ